MEYVAILLAGKDTVETVKAQKVNLVIFVANQR